MKKELLKNEIRKMLQFHKSVLLLIFKTCLCAFRYGLWLLPWIFLAVFVWKPVLAGWKAFTQSAPDPGQVRQAPVSVPPYGSAQEPRTAFSWETIPNKVDSGVRSFERISRQIRKK
ncbi:MAG: hypothetical protein WC530_03610 [Candidatus Omnitrophota bacterium]|jgi:hypothetical protein